MWSVKGEWVWFIWWVWSVEEVSHGGEGSKGTVGTGGKFGEIWESGQFEGQLFLHSCHPLQLCLVVL